MENKLYRAITEMSPAIYRDFYKTYYAERLKVFRIITTIVGIAALASAVMMFYGTFSNMWIAIIAWLGLFMLVYPRVAYRRPYKHAKDRKQTTRFAFYEDAVAEKTNGEESVYNYSELMRVIETPKYLFIYHSLESVSIVVKDEVKESSDGLCELLKNKVKNYKKVR